MSVIYTPKGKAREYSPYACNLYMGCNHGCKYCYAPSIRFKKREDYLIPVPRRNIIKEFKEDCKKLKNFDSQVLFCFISDPYNIKEKDLMITRECLNIALENKIPISILTKSNLVLRDLDIIKNFGRNIKIGTTLTFNNKKDSLSWEPEASLPDDRIEILKICMENNIKTWASFEPVIIPDQSIDMILKSLPYVDVYKIGKLNNFQGLDKNIDWVDFLEKSVEILRENKKPFYVKKDLRKE
ncbi:MAG TPA: radical SAM protein, partial [Candidatus Paceibacterota bacterium]|nr:radical SAM protein [Candidatus Paceibacterota bacterium]